MSKNIEEILNSINNTHAPTILKPTVASTVNLSQRKKPPCKPGKVKNANGRCVLAKNLKKTRKITQPKTTKSKTLKPKSDSVDYERRKAAFLASLAPQIQQPTINKVKKSTTKKVILLKSKNTPEQDAIKMQISQLVSEGKNPIATLGLNSTAPHPSSFSPNINKLFVKNLEDRADIFKCTAVGSFEDLISKFKISVGTKPNGKPDCKKVDSPEAQTVLLKNLNNITIDENQIIAPVQRQNNCWFNTLFVTFFFSDKGRKFFKYFRRLMILGEHSNGTKIPPKLAKGLMLWNLCIEASYGNKDIALAMNTNSVITKIYTAIPKKDREKFSEIGKAGEYGNPISYYMGILRYINNNELSIWVAYDAYNSNRLLNLQDRLNKPTDVVCMNIINRGAIEVGGLDLLSTSNWTNNFDLLNIKLKGRNEKGDLVMVKYKLDSAIVRDVSKKHFCSLITCNGKEMAFDGQSYSRLKDMRWKQLIGNQNKWSQSWGFENSQESWLNALPDTVETPGEGKRRWNFANSYVILFYYKV